MYDLECIIYNVINSCVLYFERGCKITAFNRIQQYVWDKKSLEGTASKFQAINY